MVIAVASAVSGLALLTVTVMLAIAVTGWNGWGSTASATAEPGVTQQATASTRPVSTPETTADAADLADPVGAFQAFVAEAGTDTERAASKHVSKIQGLETLGSDYARIDVFTDYRTRDDSYEAAEEYEAEARLIISAFTSWKTTGDRSCWLTIYSANGHRLQSDLL